MTKRLLSLGAAILMLFVFCLPVFAEESTFLNRDVEFVEDTMIFVSPGDAQCYITGPAGTPGRITQTVSLQDGITWGQLSNCEFEGWVPMGTVGLLYDSSDFKHEFRDELVYKSKVLDISVPSDVTIWAYPGADRYEKYMPAGTADMSMTDISIEYTYSFKAPDGSLWVCPKNLPIQGWVNANRPTQTARTVIIDRDPVIVFPKSLVEGRDSGAVHPAKKEIPYNTKVALLIIGAALLAAGVATVICLIIFANRNTDEIRDAAAEKWIKEKEQSAEKEVQPEPVAEIPVKEVFAEKVPEEFTSEETPATPEASAEAPAEPVADEPAVELTEEVENIEPVIEPVEQVAEPAAEAPIDEPAEMPTVEEISEYDVPTEEKAAEEPPAEPEEKSVAPEEQPKEEPVEPVKVPTKTEKARQKEGTLANCAPWFLAFIGDECLIGDNHMESSQALYSAYREYCAAGGEKARSTTEFYAEVSTAGFYKKVVRKKSYIVGVELSKSEEK